LTTTSQAKPQPAPLFPRVSLEQMRLAVVWLMFASAFIARIEPAPTEILFLCVVACFLTSGLNIAVGVAPLVLALLLYNLGGFISFLEVSNETKAVMFVITSAYMAVTGIFFAYYIAYDPVHRMAIIRSGLTFSAVLASIFGVMTYFDIAGFGALAKLGRAVGLFKDPNVFSTFLVFPTVMLLQGFLLGTHKRPFWSALWLLIILPGLFLAFSRGAWINVVLSSFLLVFFTFLLTPSAAMRSRIIFITLIGLGVAAVLLIILLSIPEIRDLALDRFTLIKYYDAGEKGRFGNQINSIPILLERPFGFGPTYFRIIFGEDPHNVYINAFSSYGWLGGVTYFTLIISTIFIGFRTILTRTPWQNEAIAVFCPLIAVIFQGMQIDTEHWRHFYWMLGLMWGLFAVTIQPASVNRHAYRNTE
jgi:hypothetical protein